MTDTQPSEAATDPSPDHDPVPSTEPRAQRVARHLRRARLYTGAVSFVALIAILTLALASDAMPLRTVEDLADTRLAPKISQLPGVGLVSISGGQKLGIRIDARVARLDRPRDGRARVAARDHDSDRLPPADAAAEMIKRLRALVANERQDRFANVATIVAGHLLLPGKSSG